jgi:hypothetical protein
MKTGKQDGCK